MAHQHNAKRRRTTNNVSYHDTIPTDDDFSTVHSREPRLRRVNNATIRTAPAERSAQQSTATWLRTQVWVSVDDPEFALDPDGEWYDEVVTGDIMEDHPVPPLPIEKPKRKRSQVSRRPHVVWKALHRDLYLEEECRWEGRGDFTSSGCPDCQARHLPTVQPAEYRCLECLIPDLVCSSCCVKRHRVHPFHRIQQWQGSRFTPVSLKSLGLKVQLNHASLLCDNPVDCHASMLVLHTNGIHDIAIQYCNCTRAIPQHLQLLRRGLYPASQLVIKTCVTFQLLRQYHILSLTTKTSTYDLYRALEKSTSNTGMNLPKSRYRALFRVMMQWRHLKLLKRAGRAHDPTGVDGTQPGELAILCPSCPRPGINLPEDWENAPRELSFLYAAILCMDANFRLKNQMVSNYSQDPGLGIGWAYMVPRVSYEGYVQSRIGDEDISTCVGLQALAKAYTKYCEGQRYTGVGMVCCGRSEMILPMAVGNLQKGERYANMDYTFGSAIRSLAACLYVLISYDIACQWFVNLFKRMQEHWPEEIRPASTMKFAPGIPKLHEPMHGKSNHQQYSLNFIPGVGKSDCECPERIWGPHNILGNSTKLQGPGTRQDYLDDNWAFWNWLKYTGLGNTMAQKFKASVAERNLQVEGHRGLTDSLDKELIETWEAMCVEWELAPFPKTKKKNPYETDSTSLTETQVRKELAEEEERRVSAGGVSLHATSASVFLTLGLDLEETQRRLRRLVKVTTGNSTARKQGGLVEQRNLLRARIRAWEQLLPIYMPGLLQYLTTLNSPSAAPTSMNERPEDAELWLPSRIPSAHRATVCRAGLAEIEERLRTVQCSDALDTVRHVLKVKSRMIAFKNKNMRGQREGTRSRSVTDRVHGRARAAAAKYRAAREAKLALSGPGEWEDKFRILLDSDIRSYQDADRLRPRTGRRGVLEDDQVEALGMSSATPTGVNTDLVMFTEERTRRQGTGETRRTLSWIWTTASARSGPDDSNDDILRSEWCKSRARANRSKEEVMLLKEEMRRILAFFEWRARWWRAKLGQRENMTKELSEALHAYAEEQASLQEDLAEHFHRLWKVPLDDDHTTENDPENENGDADDDDEDSDEEDSDGDREYPLYNVDKFEGENM